MKIIVPMAGIGSRLRPHTLTIPKPLTLIAGKPIVQRLVEDIVKVVDQKVKEITFVIGPNFPKDTVEKLMAIARNMGAIGKIAVQDQALGIAHAIHCAKDSLEGACVVAFADTLFKADFTLDGEADGTVWVKQVNDPSAFGVIKLQNGIITDFVEKPDEYISDLAIIGIYYFKKGEALRNEIQYLLDNDIKDKGEYQLTSALEQMKQKGAKFVPGQVDEWMDCGNKEVTVDTNRKILQFADQADESLISKSVSLENSRIIKPCFIGENVILKNAIVGPNVSLGDNSIVEDSEVVNSLIQTNTVIKNATLKEAMIGNNVYFDGEFQSVSIGDYSVLK